ncbi:MAG: rhodanese-like domain-containing protein [Anaerolineae bacterium]|nr:rhodanese-like domain-containing protein [Anaerolineae bacterium]
MNSDLAYVERIQKLVSTCRPPPPDVPSLSVREYLRRSEREDWTVIDSRSRRERGVSIIPGSISREAFESHATQHARRSLLVYCTVGCRSATYTQALRRQGYEAFNLLGGVLAWALAGRMFVTLDGRPTREVDAHGRSRKAFPTGYRPVHSGWFWRWTAQWQRRLFGAQSGREHEPRTKVD